MIDENLPTFYLKQAKKSDSWTIYLCQHGNDPDPVYTLRYPDPSSPASKNRYATALVDPYVPDVIYGEVLVIPEFTQPSLSADAIRQNGGETPAPEPVLPSRFTIHLYNPDQQVTVQYKPKTWNSPATWHFEMPQHTFRTPSSSTLDRGQSDPAAADTTPKLRFSWRKDSKLSKDLTCLLSGKTTTLGETKTKSKEPDITLSIFKSLRELTLYEPNLYRVEMEDFKGLEVVLLLGAVTIRDVYFTGMKDAFHLDKNVALAAPGKGQNLTPPPLSINTNVGNNRVSSNPNSKTNQHPPPPQQQQSQPPRPIPAAVATAAPPAAAATYPYPPPYSSQQNTRPPAEQQRKDEDRRARKRREEEEKKARRKRDADVDKETKRLQKLYGREEQQVRTSQSQSQNPNQRPPNQNPSLPPRHYQRHSYHPSMPPQSQSRPTPPPRTHPQHQQQPRPSYGPAIPPRNPAVPQRYSHYHYHSPSMPHVPTTSRPPGQGMYMQAPAAQSAVSFAPQRPTPPPQASGAGGRPQPTTLQPKKSSFFSFMKSSSEEGKLSKKRSSMF